MDRRNTTVQFYCDERPHAGVLIVPYTYPGDRLTLLVRGLVRYAQAHQKGMLAYEIDLLSAGKLEKPRGREH